MKRSPSLRAELFSQIGLDSGALTLLGAIAHVVSERGVYRGSVQRQDREVGHFYVSVEQEAGEPQLDVDLAKAEDHDEGPSGCECNHGTNRVLRAGGYLVLHVGSGRGGYSVKLSGTSQGEGEEQIYDSRSMAQGDRFLATILRPGRYSVVDAVNGGSAELEVAYPERGDGPYAPDEPVTVAVTEKGFSPNRLAVGSGQGQIFEIGAASLIRIELVEPYDRPQPEGPRFRFERRPRHAARDRPKESS